MTTGRELLLPKRPTRMGRGDPQRRLRASSGEERVTDKVNRTWIMVDSVVSRERVIQ